MNARALKLLLNKQNRCGDAGNAITITATALALPSPSPVAATVQIHSQPQCTHSQ